MNRRSVISSGIALVAISSQTAVAQRGTRSGMRPETIVVSEATGSTIDFTATDFSLEAQQRTDTGQEIIALKGEHASVIFYFFPAGMQATDEALISYVENASGQASKLSILGSDTFEGGGWVAIAGIMKDINKGAYIEWQADAFEGGMFSWSCGAML